MSEEPDDRNADPDAPEDTADASGAAGRPSDAPLRTDGGSGRSGRSSGRSSGDADDGSGGSSGGGSDGGTTAGDGGVLGGHVSTPPDDEELPLTEHIEEMLSRLSIVVVAATFVALAVFPWADEAITQIWYDVHSGTVQDCVETLRGPDCVPPHIYHPLEFVLMRLRVAGLAGLLAALPIGVYQIYRFMRPGLYPHERRYYLASVPFSLVLGLVGMLFSYFVILPLLFTYFITYTEGSADAAFALTDTMNLVLIMLGMTAVIFQIPLFIMLAIMMGLTSREWLEDRRIYFWGLFLGVAFLFGPDPTGMAPIMLTGTMIVLFEASLLLLRWTGR